MMKLLPLLIGITLIQTACASERIIAVSENREVTREEFIARIAQADELIVGEKHATQSIQDSEAKLFKDYAEARGEQVTFAWEFWDRSTQPLLDENYAKYREGKLTCNGFLETMFGEKNSNLTYAPLMEAVKAADAEVLATNLSRAEKAPVLKGGIDALDPKLLPPGFEIGGPAYYERFIEAMDGHGDPEKIPNYFSAQSLVDDVVAFSLGARSTRSVFLVIGEFHSRYYDGVYKRIQTRSGSARRVLVHIANSSDEENWDPVLHHVKYGQLADFIIFSD